MAAWPPRKTLIPVNSAVLIGGMATTIGTSTNLLVVGIAERLGVPAFGLFDFFHIVAIAAAMRPAIPVAGRSAPAAEGRRRPAARRAAGLSMRPSRSTRVASRPAGSCCSLASALAAFRPLRLVRGGIDVAPLPDTELRAGDRILVQARAGRPARVRRRTRRLAASARARRGPGRPGPDLCAGADHDRCGHRGHRPERQALCGPAPPRP